VEDTYDETIVRLIADEGSVVGFEADSMTVARLNWLTATLRHTGSLTVLSPDDDGGRGVPDREGRLGNRYSA
jgi:hypothetical protein